MTSQAKGNAIERRPADVGGEQPYHIPALLGPTMEVLAIKGDGTYVDATFGGGGHSRAILERLGPEGRLYGFDQDADAMANTPDDPRFTFVRSNFRYAENFMRFLGAGKADGILADLGVSFHHFDDAERGFSFRNDAPLDMRMNQSSPLTAERIVNDYDEERLASVLRTYGELRQGGRIARRITQARAESPILTTGRLAEVVEPLINPKQRKKELAQVFQALRIEANGEMDALRHLLLSAPEILREGGRLAILTYHSLEDRLVKNFMKSGNLEGDVEQDFYGNRLSPWRLVTRQPISADAAEVETNPRARSARLRCAEYRPTSKEKK